MLSDYQRVKDFIVTNLKKMAGPLSQAQITGEVVNARSLLASAGPQLFAQFLPEKSPVEQLEPEEWELLTREIEQHFDVKMERGSLIQGEEQRQRDTSWWSSKEKISTRQYYWQRYRDYIDGFLPPEVVATTDEDTDRVMDNIGNPSWKSFSYKGMVVGHVQSGKTANYSALVCKAADAGYRFIVVIAGGTDNLRDQTQERIFEAFVGQNKGRQVGAGLANSDPELMPICLTTEDRDFNKQDADKNSQGFNFENTKAPIVVVIKKHPSSLRNVVSWLRNQYKNQIGHAMLVIDDESDYASINYKDVEDPTSINKRIRELLGLFSMRSYVAYTATPYANIFIDHEARNEEYGDDLFPNDFIFALEPPSDYFSARKIFCETDWNHLVLINDFEISIPTKHKKDFHLDRLPPSLYDAIRLFLINVAIRKLRNQGHEHSSMLVHISRFTNIHKRTGILVGKYVGELTAAVVVYGKLEQAEQQDDHIVALKGTFATHITDNTIDWPEVLETLADCIGAVVIREVHQDKKIPLVYRKDAVTNAIVIGGASLSRGFTLVGLSVSYFLRTTVFYDTLMQMGRWFGYRPGYEDLCRIFLTKTMAENFAHIIEATDELFMNLKRMEKAKRTPNDFGLVVREHPDSLLQITARNKQKNTQTFVSSMNLNGHLKETVRLSKDRGIRERNLEALHGTIRKLLGQSMPKPIEGQYLWRKIDSGVISSFLEEFQTYQTDSLGAKNLMPIRHIQEYAKTAATAWDVGLYSGTTEIADWPFDDLQIKSQLRKTFTDEGQYIQFAQRKLSSGSPENLALEAADLLELDKQTFEVRGERTRFVRSRLKRPLLMLHVMDADGFDGNLAAFGVCFPDNGLSERQTVSYKVNTVFESGLDDLLDQEGDDE